MGICWLDDVEVPVLAYQVLYTQDKRWLYYILWQILLDGGPKEYDYIIFDACRVGLGIGDTLECNWKIRVRNVPRMTMMKGHTWIIEGAFGVVVFYIGELEKGLALVCVFSLLPSQAVNLYPRIYIFLSAPSVLRGTSTPSWSPCPRFEPVTRTTWSLNHSRNNSSCGSGSPLVSLCHVVQLNHIDVVQHYCCAVVLLPELGFASKLFLALVYRPFFAWRCYLTTIHHDSCGTRSRSYLTTIPNARISRLFLTMTTISHCSAAL